jgi:hypothetical protein
VLEIELRGIRVGEEFIVLCTGRQASLAGVAALAQVSGVCVHLHGELGSQHTPQIQGTFL